MKTSYLLDSIYISSPFPPVCVLAVWNAVLCHPRLPALLLSSLGHDSWHFTLDAEIYQDPLIFFLILWAPSFFARAVQTSIFDSTVRIFTPAHCTRSRKLPVMYGVVHQTKRTGTAFLASEEWWTVQKKKNWQEEHLKIQKKIDECKTANLVYQLVSFSVNDSR